MLSHAGVHKTLLMFKNNQSLKTAACKVLFASSVLMMPSGHLTFWG
jgi:hypothetical protein